MDKKINILCVPTDNGGCGMHRSVAPHLKLNELYGNEFNVELRNSEIWADLNYISKFDIVHFHKGLYSNMENFNRAMDFCKENNIITVMDIDDYWEVHSFHPIYMIDKMNNSGNLIKKNLLKADYITTTTEIFAKKIKKINKNVKVFPNSLCPEEINLLKNNVNDSGKIRFGFVMGSSHKYDMELVRGMVNKLPKEVLDKIQIVLCGFDMNGTMTEFAKDGTKHIRPIRPEENVWTHYERNVTDNYRIVSNEYKNFLLRYLPNAENPMFNNESYKRCWTKETKNLEYMKHYNNLDVLLVPLQENEFNSCKSELKFIEAGMMNIAVVASNFGPYTIGSVNFFEKGGTINKDGNCILIDNKKSHKDWSKTIIKLVNNPEYIDILKNNMNKYVLENYNLNNVTKERCDFYKSILLKK